MSERIPFDELRGLSAGNLTQPQYWALLDAVEAAHEHRQAVAALISRWEFHGRDDEGNPPRKFYMDGTQHSVEEQADRLEAEEAARVRMFGALARFTFPGDEPPAQDVSPAPSSPSGDGL